MFCCAIGVFAIIISLCSASSFVTLNVNDTNGDFEVIVGNSVWFKGNEVFVKCNGKKYSNIEVDAAKQLVVVNRSRKTGTDNVLGKFEATSLLFQSNDGVATIECTFKSFEDSIVFTQNMPTTLHDTSFENDQDAILTSFPTFDLSNSSSNLGFAHWVSWHYEDSDSGANSSMEKNQKRRKLLVAPGFISPTYGLFHWSDNEAESKNNAYIPGGISGSGTMAVYDSEGMTAIVSPFSGFMSQSHSSVSEGSNGTLGYGVMGLAEPIPKGHSQSTIIHFNANGINMGMKSWGEIMRAEYGVHPAATAAQRDVTLSTLGYNTDNGMFYYYHTEKNDTANYEETINDVYDDMVKSHNIPYNYVLLDSWWYYRSENIGGVSDWSPLEDVFPNGIEAVREYTKWHVQAHNRYWSDEAVDAIQNGGQYEFGLNDETHGAIPLTSQFWIDFFKNRTEKWGMKVYEQDWLNREMDQYYPDLMRNVSLGREWLLQMANGAHQSNLTIQYCMPYIRFVLASLEVNGKYSYGDSNIVTQARASDDHLPADVYDISALDQDQWKIAGQSMLMDALGLAPSKDGFWSTKYQHGNPYGPNMFEPYPELQSMVATLSAGPVQVGDGIGFANRTLIMKSCREDGHLLQPDSPNMPIDALMYQSTFESNLSAPIGPVGEVWYTYSRIGGIVMHYLTVVDLESEYIVTLKDFHHIIRRSNAREYDAYWVVDNRDRNNIVELSSETPLVLTACKLPEFSMFTIVGIEVDNGKWTLQGEVDKWTSGSSSRFVDAYLDADRDLVVDITGTVEENVSIGFISQTGESLLVNCRVGNDGKVSVSSNGICK